MPDPAQVDTARLIYSPVVNAQTKREIAGLAPGSELGWTPTGWTASARATGIDQFRFLVFNDPAWTAQRFDAASDIARAEGADTGTINALDPNLKPFIDRGGKLIQYHGWSDPQISPGNSTQYYARVLESAERTRCTGSYRLFMAPGMATAAAAKDRALRHGRRPRAVGRARQGARSDHCVAHRQWRVDRSRPLCPFPQLAVYTGTGSVDEAASFACKAP